MTNAQDRIVESIRWLPRCASEAMGYYRFRRYRRKAGISVPDVAHLGELGTAQFADMLEGADFILEYGCGGSTVMAAKAGRRVLSVDSDQHYLVAVREKVGRVRPNHQIEFHHCDIGRTGHWGVPAFSLRPQRWASYAREPWEILKARNQVPDLVLVDGRFRVACVLESMLQLPSDSNTKILMDDYPKRPHYHVVESFADKLQTIGRLALLRRKTDFDFRKCAEALQVYSRDFR